MCVSEVRAGRQPIVLALQNQEVDGKPGQLKGHYYDQVQRDEKEPEGLRPGRYTTLEHSMGRTLGSSQSIEQLAYQRMTKVRLQPPVNHVVVA